MLIPGRLSSRAFMSRQPSRSSRHLPPRHDESAVVGDYAATWLGLEYLQGKRQASEVKERTGETKDSNKKKRMPRMERNKQERKQEGTPVVRRDKRIKNKQ